MSLSYGFYNSVDGDRKYDAAQMSRLFDGILEDGILRSQGNCFAVAASSGMDITVDTGRAWFNHTWTLNDTKLVLTVPDSDQTKARMDAVVLEVNADPDTRANSIKIITGTPGDVAPTLTQDDDAQVWQYPLAYINVSANTTSIADSYITSVVGSCALDETIMSLMNMTITPYALGILDLSTQDEMDSIREAYETLNGLGEEMEALNDTVSSMVSITIGAYTGTGSTDWNNINLGFKPSFVMITRQSSSALNSGTPQGAARIGLLGLNNIGGMNNGQITTTGFQVRVSTTYPLPQLNTANKVYDYIAFH